MHTNQECIDHLVRITEVRSSVGHFYKLQFSALIFAQIYTAIKLAVFIKNNRYLIFIIPKRFDFINCKLSNNSVTFLNDKTVIRSIKSCPKSYQILPVISKPFIKAIDKNSISSMPSR